MDKFAVWLRFVISWFVLSCSALNPQQTFSLFFSNPGSFTTLKEILVKPRTFPVRQPSQNISIGSPNTSYARTCSHSLARSLLHLCSRVKLCIMRPCWDCKSCKKLPASCTVLVTRLRTCRLGHHKGCGNRGRRGWEGPRCEKLFLSCFCWDSFWFCHIDSGFIYTGKGGADLGLSVPSPSEKCIFRAVWSAVCLYLLGH